MARFDTHTREPRSAKTQNVTSHQRTVVTENPVAHGSTPENIYTAYQAWVNFATLRLPTPPSPLSLPVVVYFARLELFVKRLRLHPLGRMGIPIDKAEFLALFLETFEYGTLLSCVHFFDY